MAMDSQSDSVAGANAAQSNKIRGLQPHAKNLPFQACLVVDYYESMRHK
jgi:hypothetical protein